MNKVALLKILKLAEVTNFSLSFRAAYWFFRAAVMKRPCLKYLDVALDYACNMSCKHCFANHNLRQPNQKRLEPKEWAGVVDNAIQAGCLHINLQGGEILLLHNLEEYVKAFQPRRCHLSVTTNAALFSGEVAKNLKSWGIQQVVVSLDSLNPEEHDEFRGMIGSFSKAIEGIKTARAAGLKVSVNVTISHDSLKSKGQRELFDWLKSERIPYNPILASAVGAWREKQKLLVDIADVEYVNALSKADGLALRDIDASWVRKGCSAVLEQLYLTPTGDVLPCPFIHISLGNVRDTPLSIIRDQCLKKGFHGQYNQTCWVAEDLDFLSQLNEINKSAVLPSLSGPGGIFLSRFWKNRNY